MAATVATERPRTAARKKLCPICGQQPNCHHTPPQQMRSMLATSRRYGVAFGTAWASAWGRVRWPHDTDHRIQYKDVLIEQQGAWLAAYERSGTASPHLRALYAVLIAASEPEDERLVA
jgi:hypothetical protein